MNILEQILQHKRQEVASRQQALSLRELQQRVTDVDIPRDFVAALAGPIAQQQTAIIAEVKKASPSKGVIKADFDPIAIACDYEAQEACCLSVLTDSKFFQGQDSYLNSIKTKVDLPLLRKDFIIHEYQVYESRYLGADAILLIVAALDDRQLQDYCQLAQSLGMAVLVESHDAGELQRALALPTPLMGINNRDLTTFETSLQTTLDLLPLIPEEKLIITESGIHSQQDIINMQQQGVYGFLIGESLMRGQLSLRSSRKLK